MIRPALDDGIPAKNLATKNAQATGSRRCRLEDAVVVLRSRRGCFPRSDGLAQ